METIKKLQFYMERGQGAASGIVVTLLAVAALSSVVPAFLNRVFFDRVIPDHSRFLILPALAALLTTDLLGVIVRLSAERRLAADGRLRRHQERRRLVEKLLRLDVAWHRDGGSGGVIRHFEDAGVLGDLRPLFLRGIVGPILAMLILMPAMFIIQPVLAAGRILFAVPALVVGTIFLERDLAFERRIWDLRRRIASTLIRGSLGVADLKSSRCGSGYTRYLHTIMDALARLEEKRGVLTAGWEAVAAVVSRIGTSLILVWAVLFVLDGRLSFGSYIAFSIVAARCMNALGELLAGLRSLARAGNAANRHAELHGRADDSGAPHESLATRVSGMRGLTIDDLQFSYSGGPRILSHLRLDVEDGEWVWLTGESGAGKSTLFALLLGHLYPDAGRISWFGRSLPGCPPGLRSFIVGSVPQVPVFFDASIRDNLCLFGPPPSDSRIWRAIESAGADDIVAKLPGGLDYRLLGEEAGLSGGQRQRLAIARMMLHKPPLILLDEPVNALDSESSARVSESLEAACRGRTVLLIHHAEKPPLGVHRKLHLAGGSLHA